MVQRIAGAPAGRAQVNRHRNGMRNVFCSRGVLQHATLCAGVLAVLLISGTATAQWASVEAQTSAAHVRTGTALEQLVRQNQDFNLLRAEEANDLLPYPLWLRVYWRKLHPDGNYSAQDPTGG